MKLIIALGCLVASLSLATHALADTQVTATLQQPIAAKKQFVVNGAIWDCEGTSCIASNVPSQNFGPSMCRDVAKRAGPVAGFTNSAKTLEPASLDKCNSGLAPQTTTASR